jgi:hypothetical protein
MIPQAKSYFLKDDYFCNKEITMKLIISIALAAFLLGCGGGSSTEIANNPTQTPKTKTTNGDKEAQSTYKADKNGKITTIKLSGSSEDIAVSKDALFVAKGKDGVDIVKIGYKDTISSELITAIDGINAKSVTLSEDGKELYVVNEEGFVNVINIKNISNPVKDRVTTQQEFKKEVTTSDKMYKFVPKGEKGLEIYDISNPSNETLESTFDKANAYDVVLTDADTKALIASGSTGIHLLDITTPTSPNMVVRFSVDGGTKGLSLDKEKGLLFVANGDKGVLVYYLNMILDKLTTK